MVLCITGNRPEKFPFDYRIGASIQMNAYRTCIKKLAADYLREGYTHFITGMARGVDLDFALEIISCRKSFRQYAGVTIEAAIPFRDQADNYSPRARRDYDAVLASADKITYVCEEYASDCYFRRNRYMVDNADAVLALWNGEERGGTFYTINYAQKKGKQIKIVSLKTMDSLTNC